MTSLTPRSSSCWWTFAARMTFAERLSRGEATACGSKLRADSGDGIGFPALATPACTNAVHAGDPGCALGYIVSSLRDSRDTRKGKSRSLVATLLGMTAFGGGGA